MPYPKFHKQLNSWSIRGFINGRRITTWGKTAADAVREWNRMTDLLKGGAR